MNVFACTKVEGQRRVFGKPTRLVAAGTAMALLSFLGLTTTVVSANAAPIGAGFTVSAADLAYILKQIKIAEAHVANTTSATGPCGALIGRGPNQIPDALTSYGLRTVDGSCNNLIKGRETYGAADQLFPRLTTPQFRSADSVPTGFGPPGPSSYAQKSGNVFDSQPREISNLIVDQTSTNPAAIAAAGFPVRTQGAPGLSPCTTDPDPQAAPPVEAVPAGCVPTGDTLFIPNVTTDVGLSPPYNSLFTLFGQFFDHGVDQTVKGGGTVFVPLKADDPLVTVGPDAKPNTGDEVPPSQAFMVLTRAQNQPGPDGVLGTADDVQNAANTDSPFVDQSQTYTSHPSHQVFLREYINNDNGKPVSTGKLLGGPAGLTSGGMATWRTVKDQAEFVLGLKLEDKDVLNIPMIAADPYGKFIPGPARGLPQYVTLDNTLVEGDIANPVLVPANVRHFDTPFLTDIAHNADPSPQDTDHNPATPPVAPTPDIDLTASADFASQPAGTYDDEMLDAHFCAGDGRVNENIGLTTIHQVFHSEHDRLVGDIQNTLSNDTSTAGAAALAEWKLPTAGANGWNGERLFQAARFVTEMEYQHLVFEEFARKVQPAVQPFHVYHTDLDPAIKAEFAHAVYRFGHSMLTETIARTNENGSDNSISLLNGFLNPPAYTNGGTAGNLTSEQAAGSVVMGMSDQVGNELDEFVTDTLRNNLLGLPLDLATVNMARARSEGVPPLNELRRQINGATGDAQLAPYTSWADFGQNLKHPESLINFVAAYGTHSSITSETTLAGKRAAAKAMVDPGPGISPSADALDFMNGSGAYAGVETGLNKVDLWVGGLAEKTNLFGGLLGSTFNYVFENQLTDLQNGDRFYYLLRTPGMNLRAQLEGNSFAEMIMRNTNAHSLKADAFGTADCKFQLGNLGGTVAGYAASGPTVADDPNSECSEDLLLLRKPDGTIQYKEKNTVDPSGINGQSVYNGTAAADRVTGGNDNDTFLGNEGDDVIEGNGGDDIALGGAGNDRITDLSGADVLKGGPGNDYINSGIGDDIIMGGDGQDFTNGGANDNETFAGEGNDFVQSGDGADATFGDGGDDWIQGGSGQDLLIGDHGAPFFDDPAQTKPGNDIFVGQVGENDYDAEGGDDIMTSNAAIDRYAGSAGFDWATHQYDTVPADDDMKINNNLVGVPLPVVVNRDRWQEVEANSGSKFDDVIRGDDAVPSTVGGAGFSGCDVLDQTGINRIAGLGAILPTTLPTDPNTVAALSPMGFCPVSGQVWGEGNILIGGIGSDTLEGRGGNDVIDGDRYLKIRISVRDDAGAEIGTTDLMEHQYQAGNPLTLAAAVASGLVNPGNLVAVREIVTPTGADLTAGGAGNRDIAVFSGPRANYTISPLAADGSFTVADNVGIDGTDTLRNIEVLQFTDTTAVPPAAVTVPGAPTIGSATAGNASATLTFTAPASSGSSPITGFSVRAFAGTVLARTQAVTGNVGTATITGLTNGTAYTFDVAAVSAAGTGAFSARSTAVTPVAGDTVAPSVTARVPATNALSVSQTANLTATFSEAVTGVTGTNFRLTQGTPAVPVAAAVSYNPLTRVATLNPNATLTADRVYTVTLTGIRDAAGNTMATTTWSFTTGPGPTVTATTPTAGATAVRRNANVTTTFSEAITGFAVAGKVRIERVSTGAVVTSVVSFNTATRVLTINPNASLAANTQYRVTVTGGTTGVRDLAGNPLTTRTWTFTTGSAL
jgi:Ca2+-binding RTX toxin-like protein